MSAVSSEQVNSGASAYALISVIRSVFLAAGTGRSLKVPIPGVITITVKSVVASA